METPTCCHGKKKKTSLRQRTTLTTSKTEQGDKKTLPNSTDQSIEQNFWTQLPIKTAPAVPSPRSLRPAPVSSGMHLFAWTLLSSPPCFVPLSSSLHPHLSSTTLTWSQNHSIVTWDSAGSHCGDWLQLMLHIALPVSERKIRDKWFD